MQVSVINLVSKKSMSDILTALLVVCSYLEFIEKSSKLNELDNYPQLTSCAKRIGYEVSKVVFRGYFASEKLQKMHDSAIEKRTQLKIQVS